MFKMIFIHKQTKSSNCIIQVQNQKIEIPTEIFPTALMTLKNTSNINCGFLIKVLSVIMFE